MDYVDLMDSVPSALSAVASIAAAVAAWGSLRVSRESKRIAEQGALAVHHGSASSALSDGLERVAKDSEEFSSLALDVWAQWARDIEQYELEDTGGSDPRPLRHVLANGSEMLVKHATKDGKNYRHAHRSILSIIRNGMGKTSEEEYQKLLKKADGTYLGADSVFGTPRTDKDISSSLAFRWVYYQLIHRVENNSWLEVWKNAWSDGGWLTQYRDEFKRVQPVLKNTLESLKTEKAKLLHSVFPLDANDSLNRKYGQAIGTLEGLLKVGELDLFEGYIDHPHREDLVPLVLYSMGVALLASSAIDALTQEFEISF